MTQERAGQGLQIKHGVYVTRVCNLGWEGDALCGVVVVFNLIMAGVLQCCFCAVVVRRMSFVWVFCFIQELRKS